MWLSLLVSSLYFLFHFLFVAVVFEGGQAFAKVSSLSFLHCLGLVFSSVCHCVKRTQANWTVTRADSLVKLLHSWTKHVDTAELWSSSTTCAKTQWKQWMKYSWFFFTVISCIWLVLCTLSTVPEIKWEPVARSCELINVLRSAYSTPLYSSARLQLWQSIQSAALMNPLQSSWEQAGAASFN